MNTNDSDTSKLIQSIILVDVAARKAAESMSELAKESDIASKEIQELMRAFSKVKSHQRNIIRLRGIDPREIDSILEQMD